MTLTSDPNLADPDATYAALIAAHDGLTEAESAALNARLVLVLMNHIGDATVLRAALEVAHGSGAGASGGDI